MATSDAVINTIHRANMYRNMDFVQTEPLPSNPIKLNGEETSEERFELTVQTSLKQRQLRLESDTLRVPAVGSLGETQDTDIKQSEGGANAKIKHTSNNLKGTVAERTMGVSNKMRLSYVTEEIGTKLFRTFFLKRVNELRPTTEDPDTWTVDMFLRKNLETIRSSKYYRQAMSVLFPAEGVDTNLDRWDLLLLLKLMKTTCKLSRKMEMRLSSLKKIRNKLAHFGDGNISDTKYKIYLEQIGITFDDVLDEINDAELSKNIRDMLQKADSGEIPDDKLAESLQALHRHWEELTNTVKSEHKETRLIVEKGNRELMDNLTSLKDLLSDLKVNGFNQHQIEVKLKNRNITTEMDQHLSHLMVDMFSEEIKKITGSYNTPDEQKMREAVQKFYKSLKEKGYEIVKAEEGCILLHIQLSSVTSVLSFYMDYINGSLDIYLLELQRAAGNFLNFYEFLFEMNLYEDDFREVIAFIRDCVNRVRIPRTGNHQPEGHQCNPTKEIYETDGGRTSVLLTVKPPPHFEKIDLERILNSESKILINAFNLDEAMEKNILEDKATTDSAADTDENGKEHEPTGDILLKETPWKQDESRKDSNDMTRDSDVDRGSNEMYEKYDDASNRKCKEMFGCFPSDPGFEVEKLVEMARHGGVASIKEYIESINNEWKNIPLNIAVTGLSGVGKSSFINAIRGLNPGEQGYAKSDIHAIPNKMTQHPFPNNNHLIFWDMPGVNTDLWQIDSYIENDLFNKFDFFLILFIKRFHKDVFWLAQQIKSRGKKCFFIQTLTHDDVTIDKKQKPNKHTTEVMLDRIRQNFIERLKENGIETDEVFLIDNNNTYLYDFDKLTARLINGISDKKKREAFVLTLPSLSESVINEKRTALESRICRVALCSALTGTVPVPLLDATVDTVLIMGETDEYRRQFGLTEGQLQAKMLDSEIILKFNRHFVFLSTETIFSITADVEAEFYIKNNLPFLINDKSVILSYNVTCIALRNILNALAEDALKVIDWLVCYRNKQV